MSMTRRSVCLSAAVTMAAFAVLLAVQPVRADAPQVDREALKAWNGLNHWVRMARPERAADFWTRLKEMGVTDAQLLDIHEASHYHDSFETHTLKLLKGNPTLKPIGDEIEKRLIQAVVQRSRDEQRIAGAIAKLSGTRRENYNARRLLRAAGQFAVPQMLETMLDHNQEKLRGPIVDAFVDIDEEAVYPLSVALPHLDAVPQSLILRVLADLGYPSSLPYIKLVIESPDVDENRRQLAINAFETIAKPTAVSVKDRAADLFVAQARYMYNRGTLGKSVEGYDAKQDRGIIWAYNRDAGLLPTPVPSEIHPDVRTMRAARMASKLDRTLDVAAALHLMANSRRQIRLPQGERDPSYQLPNGPDFYLRLAGPLRQHDVLQQALVDHDTELARAAIAGLGDIGNIKALINADGKIQPLLVAMSHPNRKVRIEAIHAVALARPLEPFPGSSRVVPVLAEAIRQDGAKYALVVADTLERQKELQGLVEAKGFNVYFNTSLDAMQDQIAHLPGVDLVVVDGDVGTIDALFSDTIQDYRLAAVPVVAVVGTDADVLFRRYAHTQRLFRALRREGPGAVNLAVDKAVRFISDETISDQLAQAYAVRSLERLADIAKGNRRVIKQGGKPVFDVRIAQPALVAALQDSRAPVVKGAGNVLSFINRDDAQRAIADAATADRVPDDVRESLLNSLADSGKYHQSMLSDAHIMKLVQMASTTRGEVAVAVSRALGAHVPRTDLVIDMITGQE